MFEILLSFLFFFFKIFKIVIPLKGPKEQLSLGSSELTLSENSYNP